MRSRLLCLACGLASLTIIFVLNYWFMLNHYFQHGAYLLDTGLLGALIHEPTVRLLLPAAVWGDSPHSYFATHVTPVFYLLGLPSHLIATNIVYYSAIVFAGIAAFVAAPVPLILSALHRRGDLTCGPTTLAVLMLAAPFGLAFSGPVLHAINYPHFELLFPALGALFFLLAAQRRFVAASIAFAMCILTREDFAFHLFGFLFVWIAFRMWVAGDSLAVLKPWLAYLAAAAIAGSTILLAQHLFFLGDAALTRIYLGSPIYSHVTASFLAKRIGATLDGRLDLVVCLLSAAALSIWLRDLRYVLGYLACVPWLVFSLLAQRDAAGTLSLYYGFPFVLATVWPMLVLLLSTGPPRLNAAAAVVAITLAGLVGSALVERPDLRVTVSAMTPVPQDVQAAEIAFQKLIVNGLLDRERIGVDAAVASLAPRVVQKRQIANPGDIGRFRAMAFYANAIYSEVMTAKLIRGGYSRSLRIGASPVYVAMKPSVDGDLLVETLRALGSGVQWSEQSYVMARMRPGEVGSRRSTSIDIVSDGQADGLLMFGPYVRLAPGSYRAEYAVSSVGCAKSGADARLELSVTVDYGQVTLAKRAVAATDLFAAPGRCATLIGIEFTIEEGRGGRLIETPLRRFGGGQYVVTDVRIVRTDANDR